MCKRTMYKRARITVFLWERRACANSGAQAVFPRPRKNGLGTRLVCTVNTRVVAHALIIAHHILSGCTRNNLL